MTLLIACLLIHGFQLSPFWYIVASILWCCRISARVVTNLAQNI